MKQLLLLAALLAGQGAFAQNRILIEEEPAVRELLDSRKALNFKKDRQIKAWSVQVLISRDKYQVLEKMQEIRNVFREDSNIKVDWTYEQPYYRLNAGAYFTKLEAAPIFYKIVKIYPEAFIFKNDQVKPTDF